MTTDTTTETFDPILDPETGEILAATDLERRELIDTFATDLVLEAHAKARAARARTALRLLMRVGDAWAGGDGWAVTVKPPATPARQVVPHALEEHAESLRPLGLAPRKVTKTETVNPKVSDLTSTAAREALARVGLTPETFLHTPEPGEPQVVVIAPEASS